MSEVRALAGEFKFKRPTRFLVGLLNLYSLRLFKASKKERESYEISPSGYGIHWSLIDEDLSVDSLLGIKHLPSKEFVSK